MIIIFNCLYCVSNYIPGTQIGLRSSSDDLSVNEEYFLSAFLLLVRKIERRMKIRMIKMIARMIPEITPSLSWRWVLLLMITMGAISKVRAMLLEYMGSDGFSSSTFWFVWNRKICQVTTKSLIAGGCPHNWMMWDFSTLRHLSLVSMSNAKHISRGGFAEYIQTTSGLLLKPSLAVSMN